MREAVKVTLRMEHQFKRGSVHSLNTFFLGCKLHSLTSMPSLHALPFL